MNSMQAQNLSNDRLFLTIVAIAVCIIGTFSFFGTKAAAPLALVWVGLLIYALREKPYRALPILLILACYERPVLDFGLGIRGTIKLVDLLIFALFMANIIGLKVKKSEFVRRPVDTLRWLLPVVFIAVGSTFYIFASSDYVSDAKNRTIYYSVLLLEYTIAYAIFQKIHFTERCLLQSIRIFCGGLVLVAIVAILQGVGVLENQYYQSVHGIEANISDKWAIGTLGPNHSHLGSYMAIGFIFVSSLLQYKFKSRYLVYLALYCAAIGFAHSTVGLAMIVLYIFMFILQSKGRSKIMAVSVSAVLGIFLLAYTAGKFGEEAARTSSKVGIGEGDSEVFVRAFEQPVRLLGYSYEQEPLSMIFGLGFRVPDFTIAGMKPTGDNTYFSVAMDVGLVGLIFYLIFLMAILYNTYKIKKYGGYGYIKVYQSHASLLVYVIVVAMLFQEIIWPLHSRGSTMAVVLILVDLVGRTYRQESIRVTEEAVKNNATRAI